MIEEDMEDLRALFHAEGDGLEVAEIQHLCTGVQDLLTVLQLETEILVDNLKQVGSPPTGLSCFMSLQRNSRSLHCIIISSPQILGPRAQCCRTGS